MAVPKTIWDKVAPSVTNCRGCKELVREPNPSGKGKRRICRITGQIPGNMRHCPKVEESQNTGGDR